MLKRVFFLIILCLAIVCFPRPSLALTVQEVPNPRQEYGGWVTDMADLLSDRIESKLNRAIFGLEKKNGSEIAVVTVLETAPAATPKQFATELFKYWGIGKKGKNNGVLFLILKSDRRVEIKTGYGVEEILPNALVKHIIEQYIIPSFKQGDFDNGTLIGTENLILALSKLDRLTSTSKFQQTERPKLSTIIFFILIPILGIGAFIANFICLSLRPDYVEPEGRSRKYTTRKDEKLYCNNCKQPMEKLDSQVLLSYLSRSEQVAQEIGSVNFEAWQCTNCQSKFSIQGLHIRSYVLNSTLFTTCPNCQEFTVKRTSEVLEEATSYKEGKRSIAEKCFCCSYFNAKVETVPRISSYYSDGSSGGYSDNGGGFGGGDCGGGGDGGGF